MNSIKSNKLSGISSVSNSSNKFVNGTKKAFENIKKFTKTKAFRLIIALIIISGIITGITFAIIYLMRQFKQNCTNQPGTHWSNNLKMCVPDCADYKNPVCNVSGASLEARCVPDNYCDFKDQDGNQYKYDPNTCECTMDCSDPEQPFTQNGDNTTDMRPDGKGGYIPNNPLTCGIACPESTDGWCYSGHICGTRKYCNGTTNSGCFSKDDDICDKTGYICPKGECTSDGCCDVTPCGKNGGYTNPMIYACNDDSDCKGDNNKCLKGESVTEAYKNDKDLYKFKFYKKVGFCEQQSGSNSDTNCLNKKYVGETTGTPNPFDCNKPAFINSFPDTEGVSAYNNICGSTTIPNSNNACARYGLCSNDWQADPGSKSELQGCITGSDAEDPDDYALTLCCDKSNIVTNVGPIKGKFCCPIKPDDKTGACTLDTEFPYEASKLEAPGDDLGFIPCSIDEDCTIYNDKLWHKLGNLGSNPEKEILKSTLPEERAKYAEMYCASSKEHSGKKYCKATCGLFDEITSGSEHDNFNSHYGTMNVVNKNKPASNKSYCFKQNQDCNIVLGSNIWDNTHTINSTIPVCTVEGKSITDSGALPAWAGGGTYTTQSGTGNQGKGYGVQGSFLLKDSTGGKCNLADAENACLTTIGRNGFNIHDFEVNENKCSFTAACDQLPIPIKDGQHKDNINETVYWSDLLNSNAKDGPAINKFKPSVFTDQKIMYPANTTEDPKGSGIVRPYNSANGDSYSINQKCVGNPIALNGNKIDTDLLTLPVKSRIRGQPACGVIDFDSQKNINLKIDGQYCGQNGIVNPRTNECLNDTTKENFGDIESSSVSTPYYAAAEGPKGEYPIRAYNQSGTSDTFNGEYHFCGDVNLPVNPINNASYKPGHGPDNNQYIVSTNVRTGNGDIYAKCEDYYTKDKAGGVIKCTDDTGDANCCPTKSRSGSGGPSYVGEGYLRINNSDPDVGGKGIELICDYPGSNIPSGPSGGGSDDKLWFCSDPNTNTCKQGRTNVSSNACSTAGYDTQEKCQLNCNKKIKNTARTYYSDSCLPTTDLGFLDEFKEAKDAAQNKGPTPYFGPGQFLGCNPPGTDETLKLFKNNSFGCYDNSFNKLSSQGQCVKGTTAKITDPPFNSHVTCVRN